MSKKYVVAMVAAVVLLGTYAYADPQDSQPGNYRWYMSEFNESEGAFTEVAGLELEAPVIEYRNGDEDTHVRKRNGLNKYGNTTFMRGIPRAPESRIKPTTSR